MAHDRDRLEVLVNAVMNLWVSFSGRTLLYEVSLFNCAGNIASVSVYLLSGSCVSASRSGLDTFFLYSQKVIKYAVTNLFQRSRRNILMKSHANIFVSKSSVLNCFYCVSQLLLRDPSGLDNHFDFLSLCL